MLEFLKKVDISDGVINSMIEMVPVSSLQDIGNNEENCLSILIYMKKIGISNVDDLLIYKPDVFKGSFRNFYLKMQKFENTDIVSMINDDFNNIDLIWN